MDGVLDILNVESYTKLYDAKNINDFEKFLNDHKTTYKNLVDALPKVVYNYENIKIICSLVGEIYEDICLGKRENFLSNKYTMDDLKLNAETLKVVNKELNDPKIECMTFNTTPPDYLYGLIDALGIWNNEYGLSFLQDTLLFGKMFEFANVEPYDIIPKNAADVFWDDTYDNPNAIASVMDDEYKQAIIDKINERAMVRNKELCETKSTQNGMRR